MSELPNEEIDLIEFFQIIWDSKWLIAGFSLLIILPAFAFLAFIYEPDKKASINLLPLSNTQMASYNGLNSTLPNPVTARGFEDTFFRELYRREASIKIVSARDPRILEFDGTENEKISLAAKIVNDDLSVEWPDPETLSPILISYETTDEIAATNILKAMVQDLDSRALGAEKAKIADVRSTKQRTLDFEILKTEIAIKNILDDYQIRTKARKVYLAEQLAIARTLGIEENGFSDLLSKGGITGISGQNSLPFYMRGSRAIAKELSLLEARSNSREDALKYVNKYPELRAKLRALQTDPLLANLDKEFENSPFANDDQKSMNYDLASITVEPTQSRLLILVIVSVLTVILTTIIVMIRYFMFDRNTQIAE